MTKPKKYKLTDLVNLCIKKGMRKSEIIMILSKKGLMEYYYDSLSTLPFEEKSKCEMTKKEFSEIIGAKI